MNFISFPVGSTNIFPLANSHSGGQLLSEFNIRSRESVETDPTVKYFIGKSYAHSMDDFAVHSQRDGLDTTINNTTVQVSPGRAIVNGHYVESLTPINIDLNDANSLAASEGLEALKGDLVIGLRMMYSTYQTLAGSALVENQDDYYEGVQLVILKKKDLILPTDAPGENDFSKVNMHLLLASFSFKNGTISKVAQNEDKVRSIDASRVYNISTMLSDNYVNTAKLDPNRLYTFSGKSADGETIDGRNTWCDSTDSLVVWDAAPKIDTSWPSRSESYFYFDSSSGNTYLNAIHKQIDGMKNAGGQNVYYQDHRIPLPLATFEESTGGVISPAYTNKIKEIRERVNTFYNLSNGKMRAFISQLTDKDDLPTIGDDWEYGDYIIVGQDLTTGAIVNDRYPATLYVVCTGSIQSIVPATYQGQAYSNVVYTRIDVSQGTDTPEYRAAYEEMLHRLPVALIDKGGREISSTEVDTPPYPDNPDGLNYEDAWNLNAFVGRPGVDYFVIRFPQIIQGTDPLEEEWACYFYTPDDVSDKKYYDPIWLTGGVPLATESAIGGFVNVPEDAYGNGYVRLNDAGYLQLIDFDLLLTGVLAYQLGEDHSEGSGLSLSSLQSVLEENINDRVCFPNATQKTNAEAAGVDPNIIHLYLELPAEAGTLLIHDIGSRYGSSLYVHISGSATSETTILFQNCDKLRIDPNIEGAPNIYLDQVNLYYDSDILDRCDYIHNLSLWYEKYDVTDPDLQVNGMTVTLVGKIESTDTLDPWDSTYANDNHYSYALRSLTFASDGTIINVGMLVGDSTTANIDEGKSVFTADFVLPQSVGISYPSTKMTHRIKVSGTFVSHYYVADEGAYMMKSTEFSALTQRYNPLLGTNETSGTIAFYTDAELVSHISGLDPTTTIDSWDLNTPHYFIGGAID